nr:PREDICTED: uncharacterized protein LOC109039489 [Bemisia tabaci]
MSLPENFRSVVGIVLNNWTALKLSISHGYGGTPMETNAKVQDLINMIDEGFATNSFEDWGDLCDLLSDYMDQVFHTLIEDNSDEELGTKLQELYYQWSNAKHNDLLDYLSSLPIQESIERAPPQINAQPNYNNDDDSDDDDDDGGGDSSSKGAGNSRTLYQGNNSHSSGNGGGSSVDADGWQVCHNRRHR